MSKGYAVITSPNGVKQFDTLTCCHCNKVWIINDSKTGKQNLGGFCRMCMKPICNECVGKSCTPLEKQIEQYEQKQNFYREFENGN